MITHVKGTVIMDYVRLVKSDKSKNWNKWISPKDWAVVNENILPSNWYPYDSFRNIAFAVFKEIANSDLKIAEVFGRFSIKNMLEIYKNILSPGDPVASVKGLAKLRRTFFKGDASVEVEQLGKNTICYKMETADEEKDLERASAFVYQVSGSLMEIVEQAGGKNVKSEVVSSGTNFKINVTWE